MTGVDLAVAASRPRGISDALAVNLAMQTTRRMALEERCREQDAEIRRLTDQLDGLLTANESLWEERCRFRRQVMWLRDELREARS